MRIAFVIDKLNFGGAEHQLVQLVRNISKRRFEVRVIIFHAGGDLRNRLDEIPGVTVHSLCKKNRWHLFKTVFRLFRLVRGFQPDVIHSYLSGTNEICLMVARLLNIKVVWGIRVSDIDAADFHPITRFSFFLGSRLSRYTDLVIVNSYAGLGYHIQCGYPKDKMTVIHNGIDIDRFHPDRRSGLKLISELGVPQNIPLIGIIGRLHPMKDHTTFIHAAAELIKKGEKVRFVCVGNGEDGFKQRLKALSASRGLSDRLLWVDARPDMASVYNALTILSSTSAYGEGFSNTIGEAMACGVPCVVTDVGDSRHIVGDCGIVVPPKDPYALMKGWMKILGSDPQNLQTIRRNSRQRIVDHFALERMIQKTETALLNMMPGDVSLVFS